MEGNINMDKAKSMWLLSNGEFVSVGDNIRVDNGREVYILQVTDIGETYITGNISIGGEFDAYFSELKDIKVIK